MDEGLSPRRHQGVRRSSTSKGLIYKDKRLVNWDPRLQTAVSDLEVENIEIKGHLWHIKYPIEDSRSAFITVATTRPETMLGDTAVAVHPDDERYKALVGKKARAAADRTGWSPSSPTNIPIRKRAPARSRSRPATTSTTSKSASATSCR